MMRGAAFAAFAFVVLSGCVAEPTTDEGPAASAKGRQNVAPAEAPRWANLTIFNETFAYPRTDNDERPSAAFEMPTDVRSATLSWRMVAQCPSGVRDDPGFTFTDPAGRPYSFMLYQPGAPGAAPDVGPGPYFCLGTFPPTVGPSYSNWNSTALVPAVGEWKATIDRTCTCDAEFRVDVEVPE